MIPFGSQRGLGQDLAIHLSNAKDNELIEIADLRGAIAPDLNGSFAEWEAQAHGLTKCKNYLYSLSINPDPRQEPLTRELYFDYIARTEKRLGLEDQPRAVVFHVKDGRHHAHVVWSRIDAEQEKAVQLAFDHEKLMMVTREFARDHGLELPAGYFKEKGAEKTHQITLYEQEQQRSTGISLEERKEQITGAWRESDSPKAFVQALADRGYILATGRRPYVLVDIYGNMNSLPKLIDDKSVRTKDIRAFLETEYLPESLPSVEEAIDLVAEHRKYLDAYLENEQRETAIAELTNQQQARAKHLQEKQTVLKHAQQKASAELTGKHKRQRAELKASFMAQHKRIKAERNRKKPRGLAEFLGRVSGVNKLREALHKLQDRRQLRAHLLARQDLKNTQEKERRGLAQRQRMQSLDLQRQVRALGQIETRERQSLIKELKAQARMDARGASPHLPELPFAVKGRRQELSYQEKHRLGHETEQEFDEAAAGKTVEKKIDLSEEFTRAAEGEKEEDKRGASEGSKPKFEPRPKRRRRKQRRRRDRDQDMDRDR